MTNIVIDSSFWYETLFITFGSICGNIYFLSRKTFKSFFDDGNGEKKKPKELTP